VADEEENISECAALIGDIVDQLRGRKTDLAVAQDAGKHEQAEHFLAEVGRIEALLGDLCNGKKKNKETIRSYAWYGDSPKAIRDQARHWAKAWLDLLFRGSLARGGNEIVDLMSLRDPKAEPVAWVGTPGATKKSLAKYLGEDAAEELLLACQKIHHFEAGRYVSTAAIIEGWSMAVKEVDAEFRGPKSLGQASGDDRARHVVNKLLKVFSNYRDPEPSQKQLE
jgi:hypothetical protein